jgi:PhzF family phenazine biosynthesis protein
VKTIDIFQVDAFTKSIFKGNPAAVCPVLEWPSDALMQWIATENNVSETAFVLLNSNPLEIRWFSPTVEVDLCGHATLATARILFDEYLPATEKTIFFQYKGGLIKARAEADLVYLDFPSDEPIEVDNISLLNNILDSKPDYYFKGKDDYLAIYENIESVLKAKPNLANLKRLNTRGLVISAQGQDTDIVSRCFYPRIGVDEDPVTGSAHTLLTPYWSQRLGKLKLTANQASARGGYLECENKGDRTIIGGYTARYSTGKLHVPEAEIDIERVESQKSQV